MSSSERRDPNILSAWATATLVIVISIASTFTIADGDNDAQEASQTRIVPMEGFVEEDLAGGPSDGGGVRTAQIGGRGRAAAEGSGGAAAGGPGAGSGEGAGPSGAAQGNYDCSKGQNAGSSDTGVSDRKIQFAATVVKTGIAKSFLSEAQLGIEAVRQKVNRAGGVCGRLIEIQYQDDGWDPGTGQRIIEKWIGEDKYFGLAVNPSSEGLRGPIKSGIIEKNGFPVVGADGMLIGQYKDPWVWPVATSTHSVMHVMAKDAFDRAKAKGKTNPTFAIVWEQNFRFGVEGERAFRGAVLRRNANAKIVNVPIDGGEPSYRNAVQDFIGKCSGGQSGDWAKCDFVALLLEPATASQWVRDGGLGDGSKRPAVGIGAPQPLFLDSFARDCGRPCAEMWVWTSFKPPLPPFDRDPAVQEYLNDLRAVSSSADASNPHVQGAYVGMSLLVEALEQLGPAPTRKGLQKVLDSMTFESGLTAPLKFSSGNHFAAVSAQAFKAVFVQESFNNWQYTNSGFIQDAEVTEDQKDE